MIRNSHDARSAAKSGAVAGLVAGVLLTALMTIMSAAAHKDIWYGMKGAAAPFLGDRAMSGGFDALPVVLGIVVHLAISVGWGIGFAMLVHGFGRLATFATGLAYGIVVWLGMYYVALPLAGLSSMRDDAPVGRAIAFHVIFSAMLAIALIVYRAIQGRVGGRARGHLPHPMAHAR